MLIPRQDLLAPGSPEGLLVYQLTSEAVPSCHVYMEAQVFTPDSRYLLLHRSAAPHGSQSDDPEHRYLLCDTVTGKLRPVTSETGATSPCVSPDGRYVYYFITQSGQYSDTRDEPITLRRRNIDGSEPVDILVLDGCVPGSRFRLSRLYPLSTLSSDGERIAISAFLDDGESDPAHWGLWVIDLHTGESRIPVHGLEWSNMHAQYCRSKDPQRSHDVMIQENHGLLTARSGEKLPTAKGGLGADIHLIRDDGTDFRTFPWGRAADEFAQGHQCWRGRSEWAITSTVSGRGEREGCLIESLPLPFSTHDGCALGGVRNRLCAAETGKYYCHFATDEAGNLLVADGLENLNEFSRDESVKAQDFVHLFTLGKAGQERALARVPLVVPGASWRAGMHPHAFLSPDGGMAFFNSDESGVLQAYMVKNIPTI